MMDPTGGGIGKAAGELMQEMQKAQQELQQQKRKHLLMLSSPLVETTRSV